MADLLKPIIGEGVTPIRLPDEDGFVAFEYISGPDYLNEGGKRQRGANCTSVDAAIGFVRDGRRELLLIEWKYTESYGAALHNKDRPGGTDGLKTSNDVRRSRYGALFDRVIKVDQSAAELNIDDFFAEPFYQLMRQQMLAHEIEGDGSDRRSCFDRVTLAHIAPAANAKLKRVTVAKLEVPLGGTDRACTGWARLLREPDRYASVSVEALFAAFPIAAHPELADWHLYMTERYRFLTRTPQP